MDKNAARANKLISSNSKLKGQTAGVVVQHGVVIDDSGNSKKNECTT